MWQIEERIDIPQPPESVFDYLARFHNIREWDPSVLTARQITTGKPSPGTRFALTLLFGLARVPMVYEITSPGMATSGAALYDDEKSGGSC